LQIKEDSKKEISKLLLEQKEDELEEVSSFYRNEKEELEYEFKKTIQEKDKRIKELEQRLENKEKNPSIVKNKNITNHITNNILTIYEVMTPEHVEEFFKKHYKLDTLLEGIPGLARFICDGFIRQKSHYVCRDRSRLKFIMKDENGNSVEDTNCEHLVSLTAPGMPHIKNVYENGLFSKHDYTEEEIHMSYQPISNLDKDTTPFKSELGKIIPSETNKVKNDDWKKIFVDMRNSYEKNRKCDELKKSKEPEIYIPNTIGGLSLGVLQKYKEGYQKRKLNKGQLDIKGPKSLIELCEKDEAIKKQYIDFICS